MSQKPQRPFVPHRTPRNARPANTASEFRLYTPFVPGNGREIVEPMAPTDLAGVAEVQEVGVSLRPIEDFLDESRADEPDELPPVEHFLDTEADVSGELAPTGALPPNPTQSGWLETDWQHYDWRAAAALGETTTDEATNAWATTDWAGKVPRAGDQRQTAAHAIATALDQIAKRIREGELAVPGSDAMSDPATIAATLAALLGVRR